MHTSFLAISLLTLVLAGATRLLLSSSRVQGNFLLPPTSVCPPPCTPKLPASTPTNTSAPVFDQDANLLATNWSTLPHNLSWGDETVWTGGKFDCAGWTSTSHCGGGVAQLANGTLRAVSCNTTHRVVCLCDDSPESVATFEFAQSLEAVCKIEDAHDVYCSFQNSDFEYIFVPPTLKLYGGTNSFAGLLLNNSVTLWGSFYTPLPSLSAPEWPPLDIKFTYVTVVILTPIGTVYCLGDNTDTLSFGNGGDFVGIDFENYYQVVVPLSSAIVGGLYTTCVLTTEEGQVWCWGNNDFGQRGDGSEEASSVPSQVLLPYEATTLCGAGLHYCAFLRTNNDTQELWCWGTNFNGEGGREVYDNINQPERAVLFDPFAAAATELICGIALTCLKLTNGSYVCGGHIEYSSDRGVIAYTPEVFPELDHMTRLKREGVVSVCGISPEDELACIGEIDPTPPTITLAKILSGSACTFITGPATIVCAISADSRALVCSGDAETGANSNYITSVFPHPIEKIFCTAYLLTAQLSTGEYMLHAAIEDVLFLSPFEFESPVRAAIMPYGSPTPVYLCENNMSYIVQYESLEGPITVLPAFPNRTENTVVNTTLLRLEDYFFSVCQINTTHPLIVSRSSGDYVLDRPITKLACGPDPFTAWIYEDGEFEMKPSNPFADIPLLTAIDVAINDLYACALTEEGVAVCFKKGVAEGESEWNRRPDSSDLSLPKLSRLIPQAWYVFAEGVDGDLWSLFDDTVMHPSPWRISFNQEIL